MANLCSEKQYATLESWSFIGDHVQYKDELLGLCGTVYHFIKSKKKGEVLPADCEEAVALALLSNPGFGRLVRSKGKAIISVQYYDYFAEGMAKFLLDAYWFDIQRV